MKYRRERKIRKVQKQRILVLCEGKTEKFYLEGLRKILPRPIQRDIELDIVKAKEGEPVKALPELERKAKKAKSEKQPYRECWLVFDDDNRELVKVFKQLQKKGYKYAYSSISIEYWILLHAVDTTRQFPSANAVIIELKREFENYSKTGPKIWDKIHPQLSTAKKRANTLRKKHKRDQNKLPHCKPYTNMDELVEKLLNFANNQEEENK